MAEPLYLIGEDLIIASEADGRKMHREIVRGIKAIITNKYPKTKKLDNDSKIKPNIRDIMHILNLESEFSFLNI